MSSLAGHSILITRSADDCDEWALALEDEGATVVVLPCIHIERIDTESLRQEIAVELPQADWLVFTSRRGIDAFAALHAEALPSFVNIAVVGPATADAAVVAFGRADLVSEMGTAASLAQALEARITEQPMRVLIAVAENAGDTIEETLREAGATCTRIDVYRTVPAAELRRKEPLSSFDADNIFFASPSAVRGFVNQVELDTEAAIFTIGPTTTEAVLEEDLDLTDQAKNPGLDGLMEALRCAN
ncbi:MAG: uroporphyrinogen-III synthase [Candidatus Rariloculaceae bacterium]